MKTVKQIADELGVSKQAVFYRIKQLSKDDPFLASKENGVLTVSFDGEKRVKQAFLDSDRQKDRQKDRQNVDGSFDGRQKAFDGANPATKPFDEKTVKETVKKDDAFDGLTEVLQETIALLRDQLASKDHQITVKDRQIEELTATIRIQAESIQADRKNELAGTLIDGQRMLGAAGDPGTLTVKESVKQRRWQFWKK